MEASMETVELTAEQAAVTGGGRYWFNVRQDEGARPLKQPGYFGEYFLLSVDGRKTVASCDPRDAVLVPVMDWYDDVTIPVPPGAAASGQGLPWSKDVRFGHPGNDIPVIVSRGGKFALAGLAGLRPGGRIAPYCGAWYDTIEPKMRTAVIGGRTFTAFKAARNGREVYLTERGVETSCPEAVKAEFDAACAIRPEDVPSEWVAAGRPCAVQRGFSYRGAEPVPARRELAERLYAVCDFTGGRHSAVKAEWTVMDGRATLLFKVFGELDFE